MINVESNSSSQRAEAVRHAWQRAGDRASGVLGGGFAFFTRFPPLAQGLYYVLTGLWPLVALATYQQATGHEGDVWVLQAVGVLVLAVGATLCLAAYRGQGTPEVLVLAFGCALGMAAVDVNLVYRGLSAFYLVDAALEVGLVAFWIYGWKKAGPTLAAAVASAAKAAPLTPAASLPAPPVPPVQG